MHPGIVEKTLDKERIGELISQLRGKYEVIGPKRDGENFIFDFIEGDEIDLSYKTTILPPKKFFFPVEEPLYEFEKVNGDVIIRDVLKAPEKKRIFIGIHPCDIHALMILDRVFGDHYNDPYFQLRRDGTLIAGLTCEPTEYCFCDAMGTGPTIDHGYDLMLTDIGEKYFFQSGTHEGEKILEAKLFKDAGEDDRKAREAKINEIKGKLHSDIKLYGIYEKMRLKFDDDKFWGEWAERCVLCGACNFTCPTCYCFTIKDEVDFSGNTGRRVRVWDSCHFRNFATVAGGMNFRRRRVSRLKQRFYHKLCYSLEQRWVFDCVGCGRCIQFCPTKIDIREVIKAVQGV